MDVISKPNRKNHKDHVYYHHYNHEQDLITATTTTTNTTDNASSNLKNLKAFLDQVAFWREMFLLGVQMGDINIYLVVGPNDRNW